MGFFKPFWLEANSNDKSLSIQEYTTLATYLLLICGIVQEVKSKELKMSLQSNLPHQARVNEPYLNSAIKGFHRKSDESQTFSPGFLLKPTSTITVLNNIQQKTNSVIKKLKNSEMETSSGRTFFSAAVFATIAPLIVTPLFQMMLPILPVLGLISLPFIFMTALYMA